ncbi:hypothetical protein [Sutcliffiella horikoshii]|uniref:hypothetical protein n=1 Tax=Sutcliffiella horikoshii TaxID=79883 RepID=UPI001F16320C|nr:hypothetical protein [Sutcliffiella horikoshii]MCG1022999.1 hypothetical protein [Sutcliffiella horikoshii]
MRHNDEDQMEKLLRQMPKIKDDRDPKHIYNEIQPKLANAPRRTKFMPAVALVAALFIVAIIGPMFFNNMQFDMSLSGSNANSGSEENMDMATMDAHEAFDDSEGETETSRNQISEEEDISLKDESQADEFAAAEIMTADQKSFVVTSFNEAAEYAVTIGASLSEVDTIPFGGSTTTLTLIVPKEEGQTYVDALNKVRGNISYESYGLGKPFINDNGMVTEELDAAGNRVPVVDITKMNKGLSSFQDPLFHQELINTFSLHYTQVQLSDNGNKVNVGIGNTVYEGPIVFERNQKRAYYKYYAGSRPLLVAGHDRFKTIGDTLKAMTSAPEQADYSKLEPSIPDTVKVDGVMIENDGAIARIKLADSSVLEDNEETIFALEAMLMVAKEFGLMGVVFESSQSGTIGTITLNEEVSVPFSPNPIPYSE